MATATLDAKSKATLELLSAKEASGTKLTAGEAIGLQSLRSIDAGEQKVSKGGFGLGPVGQVLGGTLDVVSDVGKAIGGVLPDAPNLGNPAQFIREQFGAQTPKEERLQAEAEGEEALAKRFERSRAALDLQRERARLARETRIGAADVRQAAFSAGVGGGSAESGAVSSILTGGASAQGFLTSAESAARGAGGARDRSTGIRNELGDRAASAQANRQSIGFVLSAAGLFL